RGPGLVRGHARRRQGPGARPRRGRLRVHRRRLRDARRTRRKRRWVRPRPQRGDRPCRTGPRQPDRSQHREDTTREGIGGEETMSENSFLGSDWHSRIFTGRWTEGAGETYDVIEPATGASLGRLGAASADDVTTAATRAAAAQKQWARTTPAERAAVLRRAGALWA